MYYLQGKISVSKFMRSSESAFHKSLVKLETHFAQDVIRAEYPAILVKSSLIGCQCCESVIVFNCFLIFVICQTIL